MQNKTTQPTQPNEPQTNRLIRPQGGQTSHVSKDKLWFQNLAELDCVKTELRWDVLARAHANTTGKAHRLTRIKRRSDIVCLPCGIFMF